MRRAFSFVSEVFTAWKDVGAILPSFPVVGQELMKWVERFEDRPLRIIELGSGTGAVTDQIVRNLKPGDELVLVEIMPNFTRILKHQVEGSWKPYLKGVKLELYTGSLQDMEWDEPFDFVVSCLPVLNFPLDDVRNVLGIYSRLVTPGGALLSLEYALALEARGLVSRLLGKEELGESCRLMREFLSLNQQEDRLLLRNFPPMRIRKFEFARVEAEGKNHDEEAAAPTHPVSDVAGSF